MDITLLYFEDCPNWKAADERLTRLASDRPDLTVTHQLVETPEEAERTGFLGSPSIQVDGVDVFPEPGARVGLTCRRYLTPDGYEGAPTLEQLRAALTGA
ncbi:MAG: thioredoxin family protein [Pedococcus sp.]